MDKDVFFRIVSIYEAISAFYVDFTVPVTLVAIAFATGTSPTIWS